MAQSRPLLIPWLRSQIDSGRYPGVAWTNLEKNQFTVPWKHALRQDSSSTDVLIFKAWAEVSGNGRAQGDASIWKRNFRAALRAKGFTTVSDSKNDSANPHKVFQWPEREGSGGSRSGSQEQDGLNLEDLPFPTQESDVVPGFDQQIYVAEDTMFTGNTNGHDLLQECLRGLKIDPAECDLSFEASPEELCQPIQDEVAYQTIQMGFGGQVIPGPQQHPFPVKVVDMLPEQLLCPMEGVVGGVCPMEGAVGGACPVEGAVGGARPMEGAVRGTADQNTQPLLNLVSKNIEKFETDYRVSVYYRGMKVLEQLVENSGGFRIVYRPEWKGEAAPPHSDPTSVFLPNPEAFTSDPTQVRLTQRILSNLGEGVKVGVLSNGVYGQRLGETKAFWSSCKFDRSETPQELSKLEPQQLNCLRDFIQGISEFINGKKSPPSSLFLFLGEKWPCPDHKIWEKKLVMVEVALTSFEILKDLAVEGGASSLQSVDLQISLQEMMDMC